MTRLQTLFFYPSNDSAYRSQTSLEDYEANFSKLPDSPSKRVDKWGKKFDSVHGWRRRATITLC